MESNLNYYDFISGIELFKELPGEMIVTICGSLQEVDLKGGEIIINQGEMGDKFYIVVDGRLEALRDGNVIGEIARGEYIGEASLLTDEPRSATIRAKETAVLLSLHRGSFNELLKKYPDLMKIVASVITARNRSQRTRQYRPVTADIISFLAEIPIFSSLPRDYLEQMEEFMEWIYLPEREILMRQGDPGDSFYIIMNGRLAFFRKNSEGKVTSSGFLGYGETVGELSILTDEPRSATVYAMRECEIIRISAPSLKEFTDKFPRAILALARVTARRNIEGPQKSFFTSLSVVSLDPGIPVADFSRKLAEAMPGKTLIVTEELARSSISGNFPGNEYPEVNGTALHFWLSGMEREYEFLIFQGKASNSPWTEQCLRQSDRIFLLAGVESSRELTPLELKLLGESRETYTTPRELIILRQTSNEKISDTITFINNRKGRHHHVSMEDEDDFKRLSRFLTGRAIGLVLSGGGARGFAHIGVIKALREHGIPVDMIGGTSIGAMIGAAAAMGMSIDDMKASIEKNIIRDKPLKEYTFPFISLVRGRKFSSNLMNFFKEVKIEDLVIKYFAVASDLTSSGVYIFHRGEVWKAIRGSLSLPGIVPPLYHEGRLLVDGGLVNNIPVDVMRNRGAGRILAVDVSGVKENNDDYYARYVDHRIPGTGPSFFKIMMDRFRSTDHKKLFPGIGNILMRSSMIGSNMKTRDMMKSADVYVRLPVQGFGLLNFKALDELVELGYSHACENIEEWKKALLYS